MGVFGVARLGSIHNIDNFPPEPERAAKARRAVVASNNKKVHEPLCCAVCTRCHKRRLCNRLLA